MGKYNIICKYLGCTSHTDSSGRTTILYRFEDHFGYQHVVPVHGDVLVDVGEYVDCVLVVKRNYNFKTFKTDYYYYFEKVTKLIN